MGEPNWENRTLWIEDNLRVLRGMNSASVDLIYLDPPFNSKREFHAPLGSRAARASFDDTWSMSDFAAEWAELQQAADTALHYTVMGAGLTAGEPMQAYLTFMAQRLIEIHRVLKPTGCLYLHCDDNASHYLKQLLDAIFGASRFENEIIWRRDIGTKNSAKRFPRNTDRLFFYAKSENRAWNRQSVPLTDEQIDTWYTLEDEHGRYTRLRLQRPSEGMPEWRGLRHGTGSWNAPRIGHDARWIEREFIPGYRRIADAADRLEALDAAGLLHWPEREGGLPSLKKYLKYAETTVPVDDVWADLPGGRGLPRKERTGWPTQKPLSLLERIITISSNEGDMVLDPFAGCATACVAAERLGRQWAGIDIDEVAAEITKERLQTHADGTAFLDLSTQTVSLLTAPPQRTDDDAPRRSPRIREILWQALGEGERRPCGGCGREKYYEDFHLDHIEPKSRGGPDIDSNLQLLCAACNGRKGNRLTMNELRASWGLPPGTQVVIDYNEPEAIAEGLAEPLAEP